MANNIFNLQNLVKKELKLNQLFHMAPVIIKILNITQIKWIFTRNLEQKK